VGGRGSCRASSVARQEPRPPTARLADTHGM